MSFFSSLFGKSSPAGPDQALFDRFLIRSRQLGLHTSEGDLWEAIAQAKQKKEADDAVFKLPENYGSLLRINAAKGDKACISFINRALQEGASETDVENWWNLPDLERNMREWEQLELMALHWDTSVQKGLSEEEASEALLREIPFFADTGESPDISDLNRPLPPELQLRAERTILEICGGLSPLGLREYSGLFPSANAFFRQLLAGPDEGEVSPVFRLLRLLYIQANACLESGDYLRGISFADATETAGKNLTGPSLKQYHLIRYGLLRLYAYAGNYEKSLSICENILSGLPDSDPSKPAAMASKGQILTELGRFEQALETYRIAINLQRLLPVNKENQIQSARIVHNFALLLAHLEKYDQAVPLYEQALAIIRTHRGPGDPLYSLYLNNLAVSCMGLGEWDKAVTIHREALLLREKIPGKSHPDYAQSLENLAMALTETGAYDEASGLLEQNLSIKKQSLGKKHPDYAQALGNLAYLYWKKGETHEAELQMRQNCKLRIEAIGEQFGFMSDAEREQFFALLRADFSFYQTLALERLPKDPEIATVLFDFQLATKGILLESDEKIRRAIRQTGETELQADFQEWRDYRQRLAEMYRLGESGCQEAGLDLNATEAHINSLEKKLSDRSGEFAAGRKRLSPSWRKIQEITGENEAVVEWIRCRKVDPHSRESQTAYVALIVSRLTPEMPDFVILEQGDALETEWLRKYIAYSAAKGSRRRGLIFQDEDTGSGSGEGLFEAFWGKADEKLKNYATIWMSPDGVYNQINLDILQNPESGKYLLDQTDIRLLTQSHDLLENDTPARESGPALLIGDPDYCLGKEPVRPVSDLPGTRSEVEGITVLLRASGQSAATFFREKATKEVVKEYASPRILHIATHGYFEADLPDPGARTFSGAEFKQAARNPFLRSGLLFAGAAAKDGNSAILTAFEAAGLALEDTELVVLSACETATGELKNGEGIYGLQRAFRLAGAQNMICSLWKVDDTATQALMRAFYSRWLETGDLREAFRGAQKETRLQFPEPYYWGAFTLLAK